MALTKMLTGDSASATIPGTTVRVYGGVTGDVYRIYSAADGGGSLIQSATVDGSGLATFTSAGLPITSGSLRAYRSGTLVAGQAWNGAIRVGNVFDANPGAVGARGAYPLSVLGSFYYATSQGGGSRSGVCESATKIFAVWREGPADLGSTNVVVRVDKATLAATGDVLQSIDQGPFTIRASGQITDGHEGFSLQRAPNGKLRYIAGGQSNVPGGDGRLIFRESVNPDDISAWTTEVQIYPTILYVSGGPYMVDSTGRNHMMLNNYAAGGYGGDVYYGTAANGSTSWTWTKVAATAAFRFGLLPGDMDLHEDGSGNVDVCMTAGSYDNSAPDDKHLYKNCFYWALRVTSSGTISSVRRANGTSVGSLPMQLSSSDGSLPGADVVSSGYHYAGWCRPTFNSSGAPLVVIDNDILTELPAGSSSGGAQKVAYWTGSAWATNTIPELQMWGNTPAHANPLWSLSYTAWNWGITISSDANYDYIYATLGQPTHPWADATHAGMRLVRFKSPSGSNFASYTVETLIADTVPYLSYTELAEGTSRTAGRYGAGLGYPKVCAGNPNLAVLSAVDEQQATVLLVYSQQAPLLLDADAGWTQAGTALHVNAPGGSRESVRASVYSQNGGTLAFAGADSAKFSASLDGTTWTSTVTVPSGNSVVYLSVLPSPSDAQLSASVGIPT